MKRALGVDFGTVRIGLAISDDLGLLAHPVETIDAARSDPVRRIGEIVCARGVATVVVGMPRNMDGSYGPAAEKVHAFVAQLRAALDCQIVTWDERLTTAAAQRALRAAGRNSKNQRRIIDQAAAQVLLQSWLDAQADAL